MNPEPGAPAAGTVTLVELTDPADPLFLAWLDLWETAFPPTERLLASYYLRLLAAKARGEEAHHHPLAAVNREHELRGMAFYSEAPGPAGYLWYLATVPEVRNRGLGAWIYQEIVRRVQAAGKRALVFEVEDPADACSAEGQSMARRRIGFYRRQGARLLQGVEYWQDVGPHQPRTRMLVMIQPFEEMSGGEAFALMQSVFHDDIAQTGNLELA